jgi:O-antigen/teichoic acid export membrane protein
MYGAANSLTSMLNFLLIPLYTRFLKPEDFGITAMLVLLTTLLSGFLSLGTTNSMGICYYETDNGQERREIVWTNFVLLLATVAAAVVISSILASRISSILFSSPDHGYYVLLSVGTLGMLTLLSPLCLYLRIENRIRIFITVSVVVALVGLCLNIWFVAVLRLGVRGLLESMLVTQVLALVVWLGVVIWHLPFAVNARWLPRLVKIGFPSVFGVLAFFVTNHANRMVIEKNLGLHELGLYNIGISFATPVSIAVERAFLFAWPPFFVKFMNRRSEARALFGRVLKQYVVGSGLICLAMFVCARAIMCVMTIPSFFGAYTVIGLASLTYVLKGAYCVLLPGFSFEKKLHVRSAIEWLSAIVSVGLGLLLVPTFGKEGAVASMVLAYVCLVLVAYSVGKRYLEVDYDWNAIFRFIPGFVVVAGASFLSFTSSLAADTAIYGGLYVTFCLFVYKYVLSRDERMTLGWHIRSLKARIPEV